ncbi:MAG TPA: HDOD domain-containing protein [Steroidobacteraceae bacterium]|nr:HDOD domain-containing protein [Steroidobacteraceae bacterium]
MGRLLLFLILAAAIVWLIRSMTRARSRDVPSTARHRPPIEGSATEPPPASLEGPQAGSFDNREVFRKLHQLALGGTAIAPQPPGHERVIRAVEETLRGDLSRLKHAPRRPLLLPQLLRAVNDSETSPRELSNLIARDPALTGSLLQFANSPLYRMNAQAVESVDRAVSVLGFDGIRSLIATALIQPVFRVPGGAFVGYPEAVWEHTFRSAAAAEAHAAIVENSDPFAAQLIALVMGLASLIVFRAVLDEYAIQGGPKPDAGVMAMLLDAHTAHVARKIADDWELSGRVLAALEDQVPELGMNKPASLGRSLRFGRLLGALSLLQVHGLIDEDAAKAEMKAAGASGPHVERIWARLGNLQGSA